MPEGKGGGGHCAGARSVWVELPPWNAPTQADTSAKIPFFKQLVYKITI